MSPAEARALTVTEWDAFCAYRQEAQDNDGDDVVDWDELTADEQQAWRPDVA